MNAHSALYSIVMWLSNTILIVYFIEFVLYIGPWNHVICAGIGGYIGYNMTGWETQMLDSINKTRVQKGMVPITRKSLEVGSFLNGDK
jgi:hypothetical protein